jgi:hypothetical protein
MYDRHHVARFVAALNFTGTDGEQIKQRAEDIIKEHGDPKEGVFPGRHLERVLGSPELLKTFNDMWERQHGVLNP